MMKNLDFYFIILALHVILLFTYFSYVLIKSCSVHLIVFITPGMIKEGTHMVIKLLNPVTPQF